MDTAATATRPIPSRADDAVEPLTDPRTPHVLVLRVSALRQNAPPSPSWELSAFPDPTQRGSGRIRIRWTRGAAGEKQLPNSSGFRSFSGGVGLLEALQLLVLARRAE